MFSIVYRTLQMQLLQMYTHVGVLCGVQRPWVMLMWMMLFFQNDGQLLVNSKQNKLQLSLNLPHCCSPGKLSVDKAVEKCFVIICKMEVDLEIINRFLLAWLPIGFFRSHVRHRTMLHSGDSPTCGTMSNSPVLWPSTAACAHDYPENHRHSYGFPEFKT